MNVNRALAILWSVAAVPFVVAVIAINFLHPFLHGFEGGGLDALLPQLDGIAAYLSSHRSLS